MNRLLLNVIGLGALVVSAPAFAAPPPSQIEMWNGWYVGGNIGASFGTARDTSAIGTGVPFSSTSASLNGVVGGAQFGYNYHATPSWLLGFETDFQGSSEQASATTTMTTAFPGILARQFPPPNTLVDVEKLQWFGTVRGRLGWTPNEGALLYLTGGLAYGGIGSNETFNAFNANFNMTRVGWVVGTGVEVFLVKNWTAKVEYLYMDLGSFTNTFTVGLAPPTPFVVNSHITDQIVRVGFNYHFW
jgi:outer membrane immunogenic protein